MTFDFIKQQLKQQEREHLFRQRYCIEQNDSRFITVDGKQYLNFSSNDYLGLNRHPDINKAMQEGVDKFGVCATGSSLVTGFHYAHQALEESFCQWLNKPRCLLFSSGFAANSGLLHALGKKESHLWLDKLSHASIIDGALASEASVRRFQHNDISQLERLMSRVKTKQPTADHIVVTEGVFSMDGDQALVEQLSQFSKSQQALFCVDDAHAIGVIGQQGQGSSAIAPVDVVMATFGKAIATSGACIACDNHLYDYLINFCRHYIYSTAISPAMAWATKCSIELIQKESWRREKLLNLSQLLRDTLSSSVKILPSQSSIHAIIIGDEEKANRLSSTLKNEGIWLASIRPPTVPKGTSRLRVTLTANHKDSDIKYLAEKINENLN